MNSHSWAPSAIDKTICLTCHRPYLSHTPLAECEACGWKGDCEIFGAPSNPRALLLCPSCTRKEIDANSILLAKTQLSIIEQSKQIDASIRINGDFFNAQTISNAQLLDECRKECASEREANEKFFALMHERIEQFKKLITAKQDELHQLSTEQQANIKSLREFGEQTRIDVRETIQKADANYAKHVPKIEPKIVTPRKDPFERLVEAFALQQGISKDDARAFLRKGKSE